MKKQLKKIAWLFAFGLFMFAAPLSFGNEEDSPADDFSCNQGCLNRPDRNIGKCRYEFLTCGIKYRCDNEPWTFPKDCVSSI